MLNVHNTTTKSWILLGVALAVTVLFMVFAEPVFTMLYLGTDEFADAMYDFNLYFSLASFICIVVWVFAILYYWIIDSVSLSAFGWWALFGVLAIAVSPILVYCYSLNVFDAENMAFDSDVIGMAVVTIPIALVLYLIVSIGIKDMSTNCSTRPY